MCVVLLPNIGLRTTTSNTTQICPQHFRNFMCVHWECAWCQCQTFVFAPAYSTVHKYAHSVSETSCVSTGNVCGAIAKYWSQNHHIQQNTICPQHFRNFMCVHWECVWCQCQILVLAQAYPILHKYAHSILESSCVSTGNVRGASTKYLSQNHHIQQHTNTPTALDACSNTNIWYQHHAHSQWTHMKILKCCGRICVVLDMLVLIPILPSAYSTIHKYAHSSSETSCVSSGNVRGGNAKYWSQNHHIQHYTNPPTVLQKLHVCPLGMCVVLVPNIGISTSISNSTQMRPQHFRNFMCVHWECVWCQCQILVLAQAYPILRKYAHSTSESSCVSTGNMRGTSTKYWSQDNHIQHYTNTPTALQKLHVCPLGMCVVLVQNIGISSNISNSTQIRPQYFRNFMRIYWECTWFQCQILVLAPAYPTLHKYAHSTLETSCVSTGNVRGASTKYWHQHKHIQYYTNTPTALQNLHVCSLGMCVVLVPNIGLRTTISNTTQICPQHFRNFMCVHW